MEIFVRLCLVRVSSLVLCLIAATVASAQNASAPESRIVGRALDETGSGVPYAVVEFVRDNTVVATRQADVTGAFSVILPAGTYEVRADAPGFGTTRRTLTLSASTPLRTELTL